MFRTILLLLCALTAWAQVEVTATCPWYDREGYTPVVIAVRSDVPTTIICDAAVGDNHATLTLAVAAGQNERRTLLVPTSGHRWSSSVTLDWRTPGQPPGHEFLSPRNFRDLDVVVIDPAETYGVKELRDAVAKSVGNPPDPDNSYSGGKTAYAENRFTRWTTDELPDRWQGYPAWIAVLVTPVGERRLSEAQRDAISAWTNAGGALFVAEPGQLAAWRGIGARVQVASQQTLGERLQAMWKQAHQLPEASPVPGTSSVPVYGFVTIAVLFAVLVGPVNFWWCARRGRRHLLLVTTPVVSVIASVVLLAYGLLADGLTVRRTVVQVLALDQVSARVSGWTGMTLFAGLPPSAIILDNDALLVPLDPTERHRDDPPAVSLDWSAGAQVARGAWIPARSNRQLGVGIARGEKRRLAFSRTATGWTVANGFDQPLASVVWIDPAGVPWSLTRSVAPGQSAELSHGMNAGTQPPLRRLPVAASQAVNDIGAGELKPATYRAEFTGALLPIPGPNAVDAVPVRSWVVGRLSAATSSATGF